MVKSVTFLVLSVFFLLSCNKKNSGQENVPPPATPNSWDKFSMGADLSFVNELEDYGAVYYDSSKVKDPFAIFKDHGCNIIRVRLWYNPQWIAQITGGKLYSDLADVEKTIRRAKNLGMAVNLDIHYSDTWADPSRQETPAAWVGLSLPVLKDSVYNYTFRILTYLSAKSLTPEMVQVGNETNGGILYPQGEVKNDNYKPFGELLNAGIKAIRDFSVGSSIKPAIILHVAQLQNATWWIDRITTNGKVSDFDFLGISHYSKWSSVNNMQNIADVIKNIRKTYGKKVMIVETAYPWTTENADNYNNIFGGGDGVTGYPLTPEGQKKYFIDLTQAVISGGGQGIMYWEPAWITSAMPDKWGTGSAWDNCTLFDFTGNVLPAMDFMRTVK